MKKYTCIIFLSLLLTISCSENSEWTPKAKGSLKISSSLNDNVEIVTSRAIPDVGNFILTLANEQNPANVIRGTFSDFPEGVIKDIVSGSYKLILSSHDRDFYPAFHQPYYEGVRTGISIPAGQTTHISLECKQTNSGLYFTYDPSLEQLGVTDIVPIVTQQGIALVYEGANRESKGYFLPGSANLKIKCRGSYLSLSGKESQVLDFSAGQLWEIHLKARRIESNLLVSASAKLVTDPTNFKEFELEVQEKPDNSILNIGLIEVRGNSVVLLLKGNEIKTFKYDLLSKSSVEKAMKEGLTIEYLLERNGTIAYDKKLQYLNSTAGLNIEFDSLSPDSEYVFIAVASNGNVSEVYRFDLVTSGSSSTD